MQAFTVLSRLTNTLLFEKSLAQEEVLALKSQIVSLNKIIKEKDFEIRLLKQKQKKQDFIEKNKEIQKESVKIVSNKVRQSEEKAELKKTIEDLIKEIDVCVELLNE